MFCFTLKDAGILIFLLLAISGTSHGQVKWVTPESGSGSCGNVDENSLPGPAPSVSVNATIDGQSVTAYTVSDPSNSVIFSFDRDGNATLNSGTIDFEQVTSLTFKVTATYGNNPVQSSTATCTVEVNDVNEYTPVIERLETVTLPNGTAPGVLVAAVAATDEDGSPPNNLIQFYIMAGNTDEDFIVETGSGALTVDKELNIARTQIYNLTIYAEDGGIPVKHSSTNILICVDTCKVPTSSAVSTKQLQFLLSVPVIIALYMYN